MVMGWDMLRSFSGQLKARRIEIPSKRIQHMLKRNFESKDGMGKPDIFSPFPLNVSLWLNELNFPCGYSTSPKLQWDLLRFHTRITGWPDRQK